MAKRELGEFRHDRGKQTAPEFPELPKYPGNFKSTENPEIIEKTNQGLLVVVQNTCRHFKIFLGNFQFFWSFLGNSQKNVKFRNFEQTTQRCGIGLDG